MRKGSGSGDAPASQRTAFFLYGLLVVLPALVLGGLLVTRMLDYRDQQLDAVPVQTRDATARLESAILEEVSDLLDGQAEYDFYVYGYDFFEEGTLTDDEGNLAPTGLPSPFKTEAAGGVYIWFEAELPDLEPLESYPRSQLPTDGPDWITRRQHTESFIKGRLIEDLLSQPDELPRVGPENAIEYPVEVVALNLARIRSMQVLKRGVEDLRRDLRGMETLEVRVSPFDLHLIRGEDNALRVVCIRVCEIDALTSKIQRTPPTCFEDMGRDIRLVQGFVIEGDWLTRDLPARKASNILSRSMKLVFPGEDVGPQDRDLVVTELDLFSAVGIERDAENASDAGLLRVVTSTRELRNALAKQLAWLGGVMIVLTTSLVIGVYLLVDSVRTSQEQARRTENFVAAVTHELRTPVAAVKLYGEMLRDGWASNEQKKQEYLERIVHESDRLDGLVDRLLLKRKLADARSVPTPGSLNAHVSALEAELRSSGGGSGADLAFLLGPGLPPVLLLSEAIRDVLVNLVDNARKYAPVAEGEEPILISTTVDRKGRVLLEVSDRGPGIPENERSRIFDAFYRIGDERTRSARGTGLGLHLVALQARTMRARVQAMAREGGGATLRVTFRTLRG